MARYVASRLIPWQTHIYYVAGGLQVGGGINEKNAQEWLDAGASKVRPYT